MYQCSLFLYLAGVPQGIGAIKGQALAVSHFDQGAEGSVHVEDCAQIFGVFSHNKYKRTIYTNIGRVIGAETGDEGTAAESATEPAT